LNEREEEFIIQLLHASHYVTMTQIMIV